MRKWRKLPAVNFSWASERLPVVQIANCESTICEHCIFDCMQFGGVLRPLRVIIGFGFRPWAAVHGRLIAGRIGTSSSRNRHLNSRFAMVYLKATPGNGHGLPGPVFPRRSMGRSFSYCSHADDTRP